MAHFVVDVWRVSPFVMDVNWPDICVDEVEARSAFAAIEQVMHTHGLRRAAYAKAATRDRSLVYRAHGVRLAPVVQEVQQADYWWVEV